MRLFFLPLLLFVAVIGCVPHQQQSTIIFTSDEEGVLIINRPIDGFFNAWFPTDTVLLWPGEKFIYRLSVDPWGIVMSRFQGRERGTNVFIEKGGTVYVHKTQEGVEFGGDNASLHNALRYRWIGMTPIDSLFQTENIDKIEAVINNPRLLPQITWLYESLDSLFAKGEISSKAYNFGIRDMDYEIKSLMFLNFSSELRDFRLMNDTTRRFISLIGESFFGDEKIAFHPAGNTLNIQYSQFLFGQMSRADRERLMADVSRETLGLNSHSLLLEGVSRLACLFNVFIWEYDIIQMVSSTFSTFDRVSFYEFFKNEFPESEAVQIISRLIIEMGEREDEEKELRTVDVFIAPVFPTESIASFSDLGNIEGLQNKYILVSLWASWCGPCRSQFRHHNRLRELLDSYDVEVEKIYISVDTDVFRWEEAVEAWGLSGFHLLASRELFLFLRDEVYQGERISVPRYLLLDTQGNILNDNLALPSDMENLRMQLDKYLGSR